MHDRRQERTGHRGAASSACRPIRGSRRDDTAHKQGEFYILTAFDAAGHVFHDLGRAISCSSSSGMETGFGADGLPGGVRQVQAPFGRSGCEVHPLRPVRERSDALRYLVASTGRRGRSISTTWRRALRGRRCRSWRWCSSSPGWGSRFRSCRSISGRPMPTRVRRRPVTSYLSVVSEGLGGVRADDCADQGLRPDGRAVADIALRRDRSLSITVANLFAIRQTDLKRFMAFSSISQAGYIMLAVIGGTRHRDDFARVLRAGLHGGQPRRFRRHFGHRYSIAAARSALADYNGLYRTNPQTGLDDDPGAVLAGRHPAFRRVLLEVLRLRRSRFSRVVSTCWCSSRLSIRWFRSTTTCWSSRRCIINAQRRADRTAAQRPLYAPQPCALHGGDFAAGCLQRGLRQYQRILVRALAGRTIALERAFLSKRLVKKVENI